MTLTKSKQSTSSTNGINTHNHQECADCGSTNAQWASLNHGVVICDDCCLAHRNLGRVISIVKSLKKSYWPQSLIDTLYELVRNNSNQIWESNLTIPGEKQKNIKKPTPKDSNANRLNYIKLKYENLAFVSRGKYSSLEELNQQLFASVKTNNYIQTLRILSQGADANYRNHEDGNTCLHAAVYNNQIGQIELLCLYGADVASLDRSSQTPFELAKSISYNQVADRLLELQFELTDELSFYLCHKRPDHKTGKHFLIPDLSESLPNHEDNPKITKEKLQELPEHLFDELSRDIFDELDRRQIEAIWKCTVGPNLINEPIPFLIIKSCFTQTRNQLRQKLARFNANEFSGLLVEILIESQRRYELIESINTKNNKALKEELIEEEDPLYDRVPSDEDYASVASEPSSVIQLDKNKSKSSKKNKTTSSSHHKISTPLNVNIGSSTSPINTMLGVLGNNNNHHHHHHHHHNNGNGSNFQLSPSSNKSSNKNTPSPSRFSSKEHKILTTNFDKPPSNLSTPQHMNSSNPSQSLVANAESALNSIINSLNQIDYSHLQQDNNHHHQSHQSSPFHNARNEPVYKECVHQPNTMIINELKSENELMQSMIERLMEENAQLRAEKMLIATASHMNPNVHVGPHHSHSLYKNEDLYSTVKNKKLMEYMTSSNTEVDEQLDSMTMNIELNNCDDPALNKYFKKFGIPHYENDYENSNMHLKNFDKPLEIVEENYNYEFYEETHMKKHSPKQKPNKLSKQGSLPVSSPNKLSNLNSHSLQQIKVSPSKSINMNFSSNKQLNQTNEKGVLINNTNQLPTKDSVIKKMKKITKAVQELFRATKDSEFSSLKELCEKVKLSVQEMIVLFPKNMNAGAIQENLLILDDTCRNMIELITRNYTQLESLAIGNSLNNDEENGEKPAKTNAANGTGNTLSASSSSSSAISSGSASDPLNQLNQQGQDSLVLKNMIVSNLVSYSYEIAHTVKRIVCIMGADN